MNGHGKKYVSGGRLFFGESRSEKRAKNKLGVVQPDYNTQKGVVYRCDKLKTIDDYLKGCQYDGLEQWSDCPTDDYTPIRKRKPKIIFPFAKIYCDRISSKLAGKNNFPKFTVEEDEATEYFINEVVVPSVFFRAKMAGLAKDFILRTSAFCRFKLIDGSMVISKYNSNYCYPKFDESGELNSVEIKYVFDSDETDDRGCKIKKWFKVLLDKNSDVVFDNPEYKEGNEPIFIEAERVDHKLGFVQGEWFRFGENENSPDGAEEPIIYKIRSLIDAINYNLSQADSATSYGLDPQLVLSGMTVDDVDNLVKSSTKAWALGREGKAELLETGGSGVKVAEEERKSVFKIIQDSARIVFLDPEKMAANAQSGRAMEALHGPMIELINELAPWFEKGMISLIRKMIVSIATLNIQGFETAFTTPKGWFPGSLNIKAKWPPVFELTIQDQQMVVAMAIQAANGNIISRKTAGEWIQSQGVDFGVEDWDFETQVIDSQKTFGGFF